MPANSTTLLSKPVVTAQAAALNRNMAEFASVSNKLTPETKGEGSTIQIYVQKPAKTWKGQDEMPDGYVPDQEKEVNVVLENYTNIKWVGTVERTNDLIDEQTQLLAPMRVGIQQELKRDFQRNLLATANSVIVANGQNGSSQQPTGRVDWGDVAQAIARVETSVVGDGNDISILMPNSAQATLLGASATNYWSDSTQDKIFNNKLGKFGGADIIVNGLQGTIPLFNNGGTLAISATPSEGQNFLQVAAVNPLNINPGALFYIRTGANNYINALDMEGNQIMDPYTNAPARAIFSCPVDFRSVASYNTSAFPATITSIPLGKSMFTNSPAGQNVNFWGSKFSNNGVQAQFNQWGGNNGTGGGVQFLSRLPASGDVLVPVLPMRAGGDSNPNNVQGFNFCLVYSKLAMAAAAAAPSPLATKEEYTESRGGISVRTSIQGYTKTGKKEYRMDAIAGFQGVYTPGCVAVIW